MKRNSTDLQQHYFEPLPLCMHPLFDQRYSVNMNRHAVGSGVFVYGAVDGGSACVWRGGRWKQRKTVADRWNKGWPTEWEPGPTMTVLREESATHTVPFSQKGAEHSEHAEPYAEPKYSCFHFRDTLHSKFEFLRWFSTNDKLSLIKTTWADFSRLHHSSSIFRTKWCQSWPYKTQKRIASSH